MRRDLIVLAADKDMEAALNGLFGRDQSLKIRSIEYVVHVHPSHDAGCRTQGPMFLRSFCRQYDHAILILDREGCGSDEKSAEEIESLLEDELRRNGWGTRAAAIVLDPELEIWVWGTSRELDQVIGWAGRIPTLRQWLMEKGYIDSHTSKPPRPKEAYRLALREVRKQPSSSLFLQMAQRVGFRGCDDRSFVKLKDRLVTWFPA